MTTDVSRAARAAALLLLLGVGVAAADEPAPPTGPAVPATPTSSPAPAPALPATAPSAVAPATLAVVNGEMRLTLLDALHLGAARNLELAAGAYEPPIAEEGVDSAEGAFDTLLTAGVEGGHRETVTNVTFYGTPVTREDYLSGNVGVARKLRSGGQLSAVFRADRLRTNSAVVTKNPSWATGLSVEYAQPLLRGAGDVAVADIRRARAASRAADFGFAALTDSVLLRIETAYWNLAFAHAQVVARKKSEDVAGELAELTRVRFEAHVATVLDLADARAGLESRRGDRILAEGLLGRIEDELRALVIPFEIGGPQGPRLVPVDDPAVIPASDRIDPADERRFTTEGVRGRPELLAAAAALEIRDVDVEVAADAMKPQLDLVARLSTDGLSAGLDGALEETGNGQGTSASVGLQFSVFIGRRTACANLHIAEWSRRQASLRLRELENRAVQDVRDALRELSTARARSTTAAGEIAAAREALDGEQARERNGESTPFRVLEKEELVTQAMTRSNRAAADGRIAIARLWASIGRLAAARSIPRPPAGR